MNCTSSRAQLPSFLLEPTGSEGTPLTVHLSSCAVCQTELASLRAAHRLLDEWVAPEPSAYFDQKLAVRLREAQESPEPGWFERLRTHLQLNTGRQFRPALAGAFALVLLVGGGTVADVTGAFHSKPVQASATVQDLQILDRNDQAIQTMDQLLQEESTPEDSSATPTS